MNFAYDIVLLPFCGIPPEEHDGLGSQLWEIPLFDGRTVVACRKHWSTREEATYAAHKLVGSRLLESMQVTDFVRRNWGNRASLPWPHPAHIRYPGPGTKTYYSVSGIVRAMGPRPRRPCSKCGRMVSGAMKRWQISEMDGSVLVSFCSEECHKKWKKGKGWRKMQLSLLRKGADQLKTFKKLCRDPEALAAYRLQEQESRRAASSQT